jgi:pimeloyl-ACP methyl ester carboxylesterase
VFRLIVCLLLVWPARAADLPVAAPLPVADPLHVSANFTPTGPAAANGVLVWLHGSPDPAASGPPDEPDWVARMAATGFDIWRFDRQRRQDPLGSGAEILARGVAALRAGGYRQIIVAGHSRGAWIALSVLARPGLADGVVAISPAAFGSRPERQVEAMTAWTAMWQAVGPAKTRVVLVQLADDPYDPDPVSRRDVAVAESRRAGLALLSVFLPDGPRGHIGVYEPSFDAALGARITEFVAGR